MNLAEGLSLQPNTGLEMRFVTGQYNARTSDKCL